MKKIYFSDTYDECPYKLTCKSAGSNSNIIMWLSINCPNCKYHVKRVYSCNNEGCVICNYNNFSNKLKVVKGLVK